MAETNLEIARRAQEKFEWYADVATRRGKNPTEIKTARCCQRMTTNEVALKPCPNCGKRAGELKKSELGSRFPFYVKCNSCGWSTDLVRLPGCRGQAVERGEAA